MTTPIKSGLKYAFYFIVVGLVGLLLFIFSLSVLDEGFAFTFSAEGLRELLGIGGVSSLFVNFFILPIIVYGGGLGFAIGYIRGKSKK